MLLIKELGKDENEVKYSNQYILSSSSFDYLKFIVPK